MATAVATLEQPKRRRKSEISMFEVLLTGFKRSLIVCTADVEDDENQTDHDHEKEDGGELQSSMEIGWPTEVRHVAHVTFDRVHGFLGLPIELEPELPRRVPSASVTVFGVSTESMQCSYDKRNNSIPTILLMLQKRLYAQGGLQAEGIFRITAENSQEEQVRAQLNSGVVPHDIDVHCLAGLIKAWFRELPNGVLDRLTPSHVMECESEEECVQLASLLPSAESGLLDWAIDLMADVVQQEHHNKMNQHNVATVFAPNLTQMADPLTALMHAVQVMKFLKTMIQKVLRERQESAAKEAYGSHSKPSDDNSDNHAPLSVCFNATHNNRDPNEATVTNREHVLLKKNKRRRMMMMKMKKSAGIDPLNLDVRKIPNNEICTTTFGRIYTTRLEGEDAW